MDAADKLRKFREAQGLTQEQFAKEYEFSQAAVSAWEMRRKCPSWPAARKLQGIIGTKAERWLDVVIVPLPKKKSAEQAA